MFLTVVNIKKHVRLMFIIIDVLNAIVYNNKRKVIKMRRKKILLFPQTEKYLQIMGEQIKLARLRRNIPMTLVCERAKISRATLWSIEKGSPSVAIGYYAAVLHALNNMDKDLLLVAKDDELGRTIQDLNLRVRARAGKR